MEVKSRGSESCYAADAILLTNGAKKESLVEVADQEQTSELP